ncbi:MAG: Holliday junction resolvase RuvX [Gemmatimonadales bacterium]|nr:Holliday junction resolvase RuvX [Gemmatimonadales bacterium]NIN10067.1 Holliday junction resolvase RuvX [Gemmatimonadales bacterium]NIQ98718.1 Holliday junction resolvase RuvX [Gemmatimonadales bacterium]NIS63596.1 Holliday junction resolvase RuvX [Gemmatimonadales bacterium]
MSTDRRIGGPADESRDKPPNRRADLPLEGRLLGVDVGDKRIGLALSDPSQTLAQPLTTLTRRAGRRFPMQRLKEHLDAHHPVGVVVGLPLSPDGAEDERAARVRATGALIAEKTGLPVGYWDERMTTGRAIGAVKELRGSTRGRKGDVDQLAATVLLQLFLDSRRQ